ncbi:MAG: 16S rRNA (cytosine(967)-C(5))-methyltransferase RsmB [Deltaproteobacteria bacterium]|nr:16S rRNA (cytosine(967)-C(5))-methyltransferase RsmB [Deltaproteobacteria bacterium]
MPSDARKTALMILNRLGKGRSTLDNLVDDILNKNNEISGKDRALSNALVFGVLRRQGKLDYVIKHFSKTPLNKIDPEILNILRIGLFQITDMSRIPVSAAVNTSVEMAKATAPLWVVRYVNGLLRNAARNFQEVVFPSIDTNPAYGLSVSKSFPEWLVKRWLNRFEIDETIELCDALNVIPPVTIRTNTLLTARDKLMEAVRSKASTIKKTCFSPSGICLYNLKKPIHEFNAFKKGWFQVQDEAAQLSSILADPQPKETVLDACAGLGGKTAHLAQLMKNQGAILAMDNNAKKLSRLDMEMKRLGISIVSTLRHDLKVPLEKKHSAKFDKILFDAPCSGLGVIRRNPDTKWRTSETDIIRCAKKQLCFLCRLADNLKPGGILVYTVCSTEPEENEQVINAFLSTRKDFAVDRNFLHFAQKAASLVDDKGYLKTFPHLHQTDGFFSVRMKRLP